MKHNQIKAKRFIVILPAKYRIYLAWKAREEGITRANALRQIILKQIKKDKEYPIDDLLR